MRQQHLVNLEALAREQLLRHDWDTLPATLAALLSAQVHCCGAPLPLALRHEWLSAGAPVTLPHMACVSSLFR